MQLADFVDLATRVGPILVFLVAITVVAELADGIGLFAIIARWAAVLGRGSVLGLWLLVVLVATVATAVLSLDTTGATVREQMRSDFLIDAELLEHGFHRAPQIALLKARHLL